MADIFAKARAKGRLIGVAESCTGGLLGAKLTEGAGASAFFIGGILAYSNAAKVALLGVRAQTLDDFGAVSEEVACEMAQGVLERLGADIALSITGIAGPGGSEHKAEGQVCFGCAVAGGEPQSQTVQFGAIGRQNVRESACQHALFMLDAVL